VPEPEPAPDAVELTLRFHGTVIAEEEVLGVTTRWMWREDRDSRWGLSRGLF
jgi:hypothetical protein